MAEEIVQNENKRPARANRVLAAIREWFRKKIVALKVKPQIIPLVMMTITTVYFMLILYIISMKLDGTMDNKNLNAAGICIFITTLLSLLYLVSFLNAFPKRSKPNIFFIVLTGVMIAAQIACDLVYYLQAQAAIVDLGANDKSEGLMVTQWLMIGHITLLGVSALLFALLPLYAKLIRKIDTSVKLDSATEHMRENIDIEED